MGILGGRWQAWRTIAGMIAVITAALAASAAGLLAAVASDHSLAAALAVAGVAFVAILWALMRIEKAAWLQAARLQLNIDADAQAAGQD
jgi:threonine/homoserine/homoserine lactone efflux protein